MKKNALLIIPLVILAFVFNTSYYDAPSASANAPGINQLVNADASGNYTTGSADSTVAPLISGDGQYAAFISSGSYGLTDTNSAPDAFLKNLQTGAISIISLDESGDQLPATTYLKLDTISYDGHYVVYAAYQSYRWQSYIRNNVDNTTTRIYPPTSSEITGISANGRFMTYYTPTDVSGSGIHQVYVYDSQTNTSTLLSKDSSGSPGTGNSGNSFMSCSGNIIAFSTYAQNITGDTSQHIVIGEIGPSGMDLTVPSQIPTGATLRSISCNGNKLLVVSNGLKEYDRITQQLTGSLNLGHAGGIMTIPNGTGAMSGDGRFVAFSASPEGGIGFSGTYPSTDAQNDYDVYVRDLKTSTTELVTFTVAGNRSGRVPAPFLAISEDGTKVMYYYNTPPTSSPTSSLISGLTSGMTTQKTDIYTSETGY